MAPLFNVEHVEIDVRIALGPATVIFPRGGVWYATIGAIEGVGEHQVALFRHAVECK
jgi:hypothetical protein